MLWYLSLRALDLFYNKYARWPGQSDHSLEVDQLEVFKLMKVLCIDQLHLDPTLLGWTNGSTGDSDNGDDSDKGSSSRCNELLTKDHAIEMVRYGGIELHNVSALIGGIAAQEVIKIVTHQFVPFRSTYIFNGIAACGATYDF